MRNYGLKGGSEGTKMTTKDKVDVLALVITLFGVSTVVMGVWEAFGPGAATMLVGLLIAGLGTLIWLSNNK
jgi:hypothetical protein